MKKITITRPAIKLIGINIRTNNADERIAETAKIGPTIKNYFENNLSLQIPGRIKPGTTYCVYTDYESDENGEYTYFVGEAVDALRSHDPHFTSLTLPASHYVKFECGPGKMPWVCINAWKKIWQMQDADLGGKRTYHADFEIYEEQAKEDSDTTLAIYIGIQPRT